MRQQRIVQRYKTNGCLLWCIGGFIALFCMILLQNLSSPESFIDQMRAIVTTAIIVTPLVFAFKKLRKPTLVQEIEYYDEPTIQIIDSRYIPTDLRRAVLERDNYRCQQCGSNSYLELDHIIPRSRGGATSYENLQVLCHGCNLQKGNR